MLTGFNERVFNLFLKGSTMKLPRLAAALAGALIFSAHAAAPMSATTDSGVYRMQLGAFQVSVLSDGTATLPIGKLLTHVEPSTVSAALQREHLGPMLETSINAFLINTGGKLVLIDTGAGDYFQPPAVAHAGRLQERLKNAGYTADQVDMVLLTHIHGDHSGGLSRDGKALFPNAVVYVDRRDAAFWLDRKNQATSAAGQRRGFDDAAAMLEPYVMAGRLKTFDGATEILPGVHARPAYGHTPGHSYYEVESGGQKLLLVGDMLHAAAVQLPNPDTTVVFDVDADQARAQRKSALANAARQGYWIGAAHVSYPGLGHVQAAGQGGYHWQPANYSGW